MYAENIGKGARWLPGILKEANGPVSFTVELEDGHIVQRHSDHLCSCTDISREEEQDFSDDLPQVDPDESIPVEKSEPPPLPENSTQQSIAPDFTPKIQCSTRIHRPPNRYQPGLHKP